MITIICASVFLCFGFRKALGIYNEVYRPWVPLWIPRHYVQKLGVVAMMLDVLLACELMLPEKTFRQMAVPVFSICYVGFTIYGCLSILNKGTCSCGKSFSAASRKPKKNVLLGFIGRNTLLFGTCVVSVSLDSAVNHGYVPSANQSEVLIAVTPIAVLGVVCLLGLMIRGVHQSNSK